LANQSHFVAVVAVNVRRRCDAMPAEVHAGDGERIERRIERGGVVPSDQSMRRDFEGGERESELVRVGL